MKQQDIAIIIVIAFISAGVSLALSQYIFTPKQSQQISVETVTPINSQFTQPDTKIFNDKAINPTQLIQIGGSNPNNKF